MSTNDEKVREMLNKEPVPSELEPEKIKIMLDEKAPVKKRKNIKKTAARVTAGAAACAVLCGTAVHFSGQKDLFNKGKTDSGKKSSEINLSADKNGNNLVVNSQAAYMSGAAGYEDVYTLYKKAEKKYSENRKKNSDLYFTEVTAAEEFDDIADEVYETNSAKSDAAAPMETQGEISPEQAPEPTDAPMMGAQAPAAETPTGAQTPDEDNNIPTQEPDTNDDNGFNDGNDDEEKKDHSETYNQEEGVLEADIVKTDGNYIYYLYNSDEGGLSYDLGIDDEYYGTYAKLNVAAIDNGKFTDHQTLDISVDTDFVFGEGYDSTNLYVSDMYLYNDMLLVVGTVSSEKTERITNSSILDFIMGKRRDEYCYYNKSTVFVSMYTTGDDFQLIDTYYQEGNYDNVRISPDGYMYLISDYTTQDLGNIDEDQLDGYIPKCGVGRDTLFIRPEDILMPEEELEESNSFGCTVIGSIDLNVSGEITAVDSKALAGYTGEIYSSAGNLYTSVGWDDTEITRIAVGEGLITPAANGTVEGRIKDQFSMSEYGGYFRIATTKDTYEDRTEEYTWYDENDTPHTKSYAVHSLKKRDNRVYVLDMDMNIVGSIADFGIDEEIKSVNFSGDTVYVVTYEQTDPLFAIDLSDPANPTIMDEFKILGYSTYMQKWQDGMLLGFGVSADENGIEQGIKLTMFDNSDPYNLNALDTYEMNRSENGDEWLSSVAVWERKSLLIAPEKNLIGVPVMRETWNGGDYGYQFESSYAFFSFEDGSFVYKGDIVRDVTDYNENDIFYRSVYVGDYVYILCGNKFVAADINTMEITDEINFGDVDITAEKRNTLEDETSLTEEERLEQDSEYMGKDFYREKAWEYVSEIESVDAIIDPENPEFKEISALPKSFWQITNDYEDGGSFYELTYRTTEDEILGPIVVYMDKTGTIIGLAYRE